MFKRLYLDLETTLLDHSGSIVEIAAEYYVNGKLETSFNAKGFDESAKINLDALKVNHHTMASLRSLKTEKDLIFSFVDWLVGIKGNPELAGINIHFDYHFLKARAEKYNINLGSVLPYRLHDMLVISRFLVKLGILEIKNSGKGNSLKDLVETLQIPFKEGDLHTAKGDVSLYYALDCKLEELARQAMCKCKV